MNPYFYFSERKIPWGGRFLLPQWGSTTKPAFWLGVYSKLLFATFVAYHAMFIAVAIQLLKALPYLWDKAFHQNTDDMVGVVCLIVAVAIVLRLSIEVWDGVRGLVTAKLDHVSEPLPGILCTKEQTPQLHELISEVGEQVKSPLPHVVRITPRAECYVCENRRFSISPQRELTLVLGLPHLAVLNTSELKVIIAHELAHFRWGDTRLGVFLHRFLESLRDANQRQQRTRLIDPVYWIRSVFFRVALVLFAPVWKHQELRADVASAKAYGGRLTARTLLREWMLSQQFQTIVEDFSAQVSNEYLEREGLRLNLYHEFAVRFRGFSPQAEEFVRQRLALEEVSSLLDTHPTMHSRVDAVLAFPEREPSNLRPASHLIFHFTELEEQMQRQLFEEETAYNEIPVAPASEKQQELPHRPDCIEA